MKRAGNKPKRKSEAVSPVLSKGNTMTPSNVPEKPKLTVKRNIFDLEKFERRTLETEIELKTVTSIEEMNTAVDGDDEKLVKIFNTGYRRSQINEAKAELGGDNFVSPKIVSGFVNQFKPLYPAKDDSPEAKKAQLQQVYGFIRSTPALLDAIKSIAAAMKAAGTEEEEDGEESETE